MAEAPAKDYTPTVPSQVKRQVAEAEAIRAQMAPPAEGESGAPPNTPPAEPGAPSQPADVGQPADEGDIDQRYKSLHGRFEQLMRVSQGQQDRIGELERLVQTTRMRGEPAPAAPEPVARPRLVTDEETSEYGKEFLEVVGKRAKEEYAPEFEQLSRRLKQIEQRVDGVGSVIESTQVHDVYATLAVQVPNWREINRSDTFKLWLQHPDQFSGRNRQEMLSEAFAGHETGRVVAFFKGFLTEVAGTPPTSSSPGTAAPPLPGNGNGSGRPSLEDFAAPGKARSAPQQLSPDKPVYTSAWIAKFMADKRTGKYRGREADADAVERDIYQAQHEGRIQ